MHPSGEDNVIVFPHARTSSGRAVCIATKVSLLTPGMPARAAASTIAGQYSTRIEPVRFCSPAVEALMPMAREYGATPPKASINSATEEGAESSIIPNVYRISVDRVNRISVDFTCNNQPMGEAGERLKAARVRAKFTSARSAAIKFGWPASTYASHENGQTPQIPHEDAKKYARAFKVSQSWLLTGEGTMEDRNIVPLMGRVGAGAEIGPEYEQVPESGLEEITTAFAMVDDAIAFEVVGASMMPRYDPGAVIITTSRPRDAVGLIGREVAVRTADGKRYLKVLKAGTKKGRYTLESMNALPIVDAKVEWLGEVLCMIPPGRWHAVAKTATRKTG